MPLGSLIVVRLSHARNAPAPILVTLSGIVTLIRFLQLEKPYSGILVPPLITTVVRVPFGKNSSIVVGRVAAVIFSQLSNA